MTAPTLSQIVSEERFASGEPSGRYGDPTIPDGDEPFSSHDFDDDDAWEELEPDPSDLDRCDDWDFDQDAALEDDDLFDPEDDAFQPDLDDESEDD